MTAAPPTTTSRPFWQSPAAWLLAVVAIALIGAFALAGGDDDVVTAVGISEFAEVAVSGSPLPPFDNPSADSAIGQTAPTVTGSSFDGTPVTIETGSPTVIGFFAHWCPHCQDELPQLTDWLADGVVPDGVEFFAVSTAANADAPNFPPSVWFDDVGYPESVLIDDEASTTALGFGLTGFPYWVVLDADGEVVFRAGGQIGRDQFVALVDLAAAS